MNLISECLESCRLNKKVFAVLKAHWFFLCLLFYHETIFCMLSIILFQQISMIIFFVVAMRAWIAVNYWKFQSFCSEKFQGKFHPQKVLIKSNSQQKSRFLFSWEIARARLSKIRKVMSKSNKFSSWIYHSNTSIACLKRWNSGNCSS